MEGRDVGFGFGVPWELFLGKLPQANSTKDENSPSFSMKKCNQHTLTENANGINPSISPINF